MSPDVQSIQELIAQLGPATPQVAQIVRDAADSWIVGIDDQTLVRLGLRERPVRLELSTLLGHLDAQVSSQVLRELLMFNFVGRDGGPRIGMDANGTLYAFYELPQGEFTLAGLQASIRSLAVLAQGCKAVLASGPARHGRRQAAVSRGLNTV